MYCILCMSIDHFEHLKSLRDFLSDIPEVTQTLKDAPSVLGMNIINEPFPGNFYEDRAGVKHDHKSAINNHGPQNFEQSLQIICA